jgi:hypothetical protein
MGKLSAILPVAATLSLLTVAGCATKEDIEALRADIAAQRTMLEAASTPRTIDAPATGTDVEAIRSDIAALRRSIRAPGTAGGTAAPGGDTESLRAEIRDLRAAIEAGGAERAGAAADETVAAKGPPPPEYQKVSTLVGLPEFIPGLGALYARPQTVPPGPFLAYDRDDRLVSTIYMIPLSAIQDRKRFEHLAVGDPDVQEVDFYYNPGHPGVDEPHYHVVLWHVPPESAKLQ